jgi:metal-responsive CopG/Arc/MetJ family transcriptional regulator
MASLIMAGKPYLARMSTEEEMTKTTFRMPKSLLKEIQHQGIEKEMTDTEIFNAALRDWLAKDEAMRKEGEKLAKKSK